MRTPNLPLAPRCAICGGHDNLFYCNDCRVVEYCSKEHQSNDTENHNAVCSKVKQAQAVFDREQQKHRESPGDGIETLFGHSGRRLGRAQRYLSRRCKLLTALLNINTYAATQAAYDHVRDIIHPNRRDDMNVRCFGPSLLLRLGRDQECFNSINWFSGSRELWTAREFPLFNTDKDDAFGSIDFICQAEENTYDLTRQIAMILLKIRLLLDLRSLQSFPEQMLMVRLPKEIVDIIRALVPRSDIVRGNKEIILRCEDHSARIEMLERQIKQLFYFIDRCNQLFWPALLYPDNQIKTQSEEGHQTRELQKMKEYTFDAWNETPGAIDLCRELQMSWQK